MKRIFAVINEAELYKTSLRLTFKLMANPSQCKIVLLEADSSRRDFIKSTFLRWGYIPFVFEKESICLDNLTSLNPDLVISGSCTSEGTIRFINSLKMIRQNLPVLLFANDGSVEEYIRTIGFTGVRVFHKNISLDEFRNAVLQALDPKASEENDSTPYMIVGSSPDVLKIKKLIPKIGQSNQTVVLEGESGTGKELLARAIHRHSKGRNNPFIKINAFRLPYQLLDSELFGYNSSRLTNLPTHKNGVLTIAEKCTFFVDEISAIPNWLQAKISEFIKNGSYPLDPKKNENKKNTDDIRIIVATTRNLSGLVKKGAFREDLFFLLNVLNVRIPPLRERIADIPALTDFLSFKLCHKFNMTYRQISPRTISKFCEYNWPGNLKELEKILEQIILSGREEDVVRGFMEAMVQDDLQPKEPFHNCHGLADIQAFLKKTNTYSLKTVRHKFVFAVEQRLIGKALERAGGNRKKAAEILDISYKSLLNKMKLYQ